MPFKKGYKPFNTGIKGYTNAGSFKKKNIPWNKGIPTTIPICKKCGLFLSKHKKHHCKNVDLKKNRRCLLCHKKLNNNVGGERYRKICGYCSKKISREKEKQLRKKLIKQFGGRCQKCGYFKFKECLEFHHLDKTMKKRRYFLKDVVKYPEKFKLYCNRCHREEEVILRKLNLRHKWTR